MADDLSDVYAELRKLKEQVRVLMSANPLEASSITSGRIRLIGGTLRVDSGGSVQIVGTLSIDGTTNVTGSFTVSGPWSLTGNGTISGNVTITGTVSMVGDMNVTGNINVTGSGRVKVGNMTLDPSSNGGSVKFSGGPEVYASGGELSLYSGGAFITLNGSSGKLNGPGAKWFEVTGSSHRAVGIATKTAAETGLPPGVMHIDSVGNLFRVV